MNDTTASPTPKERLALSRAELLATMGFRLPLDMPAQELPRTLRAPLRQAEQSPRHFLARWWRRQPASSAYEFLEPGLHRYAKRHPDRLMGYAAGAGGLLVLLKPWRILSLSAGIALAFKAFDVVDLAAELWNKRSRRTRHQENLVSRPSDSPYPAEVPGHE